MDITSDQGRLYDLYDFGQFINCKILYLYNKTNIENISMQKMKKSELHVTYYNFELYFTMIK